MTDEGTPVPVLVVLITDYTQTVLILVWACTLENRSEKIANKKFNRKRG
jgi:hypothetical protein